ncbi:MAG: hypothetical protein HC841_05985 [Verrucomicrobiae bacterium]|nr:hypothetical protein [Verrucomicrobiae bacterium]
MKRAVVILVLGVAAALLADVVVYRAATASSRELLSSAQPEMEWLRHEFHLSDAEWQRVAQLHAEYLPLGRERYRRIGELNEKLAASLDGSAEMTPAIRDLIRERALLRAASQEEMLNHFFAVSRAMPSDEGRRYLAWESVHTCLWEHPIEDSAYLSTSISTSSSPTRSKP